MIDGDIFKKMNEIVDEVGPDPKAVSHKLDAKMHPAYGTINGMVTRVLRHNHICLNENQPEFQRIFANWHEDFHILDGHLEMAGFLNSEGFHVDVDSFSSSFSHHLVVYTEKIANLGAADQMMDSGDILMRLGYGALEEYRQARRQYLRLLETYRRLREALEYSTSIKLKCQFADAQNALRKSYEKVCDLEDNTTMGDFMTIPQIAAEYGYPEHYVQYKLEALRIQGFDIDIQELKSYEKVFTKERIRAGEKW